MTNSQRTFADKLNLAKQRQFVGREKELQLFKQALGNDNRTSPLINVHGQGGVGKSTLLDAFRHCTEESDAYFFYIDIADLNGSVEIFKSQLGSMLSANTAIHNDDIFKHINQIASQKNIVIAIDTFEESGDLNRWFRETFLPKLTDSCLVVIAGRHPLTDLWQSQPEWRDLIQALPLDNFDLELTKHYLKVNGISEHNAIEQAWRYTSGYPLALSLSINLTSNKNSFLKTTSHNDVDMVTALTQRWLREIPDANLLPLIEAACVVRIFNQNSLESICGKHISETEFHELQDCSFIRKRRTGWSIHKIVRDVLEKELSQRNPERHLKLRMQALTSFAHAAIKPSPGLECIQALHEFFYLLGDSLVRAALYETSDNSEKLYIENADNTDIAALESYMQDWRMERGTLSNVDIELFDKSRNQNIHQQIVSEPREPEFINIKELLDLFPVLFVF